MPSVLIRNVGTLVSGDMDKPLIEGDSLYIENGVVREIGSSRTDADTVVNANGLTVAPGMIDSHVHPTFGDHSPLTNTTGWMRAYLHGGTTTLVSAGEQHVPGLPYGHPQDPEGLKYNAILAKKTWQKPGPLGVKVIAGAMLFVPGLEERDFDDLARTGCLTCGKFIFYPFHKDWDEALQYMKWGHDRGMVMKVHSGGISRSAVSQACMSPEVLKLQPDIVGHITGGPIAMPAKDMETIVAETDTWLEIVAGANYRRNYEFGQMADRHKAWRRVIIGTDTPSGAGIMPRGMMRILLFLSGVCGVKPEEALCMASGNVARAHKLEQGFIAPGKPADLFIMDNVYGSAGKGALQSIAQGDLPGITLVMVDGQIVVRDRSDTTPTPEHLATIEKERQ